jgi:hypothetical protein
MARKRRYFPKRALDHGIRLFSLFAFRERVLSNIAVPHTCHAANRLLQRSRRLANPA